jgi:hypothetical protein
LSVRRRREREPFYLVAATFAPAFRTFLLYTAISYRAFRGKVVSGEAQY